MEGLWNVLFFGHGLAVVEKFLVTLAQAWVLQWPDTEEWRAESTTFGILTDHLMQVEDKSLGLELCFMFTYRKKTHKRKGNGTQVGPEGQWVTVYLTYKGGRMMSKTWPITLDSTS